nr:hypothetical protein [Tanacetum cinerariifolium]
QANASQVIDDVINQLSFDDTKLDGWAGFPDVARNGIESYGLSHHESFRVDDLDLNLNKPVDLNVSQMETQYELFMFEEPDVVKCQEPIVVEEDESAPSDGQFFYDDEGRDTSYETEYDVQSSENVGTNDDDEDEEFLVDEEHELVEPDVDVHLFGISMDVLFDNIGVTNIIPDDVLEREDVDVINADGFNSDPGEDDEISNYIKRRAKSDLLLNNICEVFNGKIVGGRDKPVITILEYIREYCMKRIVNVKSVIDKCTGPLTPVVTKIMESIKKESHFMKVQWNGANKYQVLACKSLLLVDYMEENILSQGRPKEKRKRSKQEDEPFVNDGLSAADGQGGAGGPAGADVGVGSQASDNGNFPIVNEEDLILKKISPMAKEIMVTLREDLHKKGQ